MRDDAELAPGIQIRKDLTAGAVNAFACKDAYTSV
jgi:hypothetical protein